MSEQRAICVPCRLLLRGRNVDRYSDATGLPQSTALLRVSHVCAADALFRSIVGLDQHVLARETENDVGGDVSTWRSVTPKEERQNGSRRLAPFEIPRSAAATGHDLHI